MKFISLQALIESLKIVYKGTPPTDKFQIDKFTIHKSNHTDTIRKGDKDTRDFGVPEKEYRRVISKFVYNHKPKNGEYHIFYMPLNKGDKYNDVIVIVKGKDIFLKTIIQKLQDTDDYFTKKNDNRIILESY